MATWYQLLLRKMKAPGTAGNTKSFYYWAVSEGSPPDRNNWLNTTYQCCGGTVINSDGVMQYPSVSAGVQATYNTLRLPAYKRVFEAFVKDEGQAKIWKAINESPWCSGCQAGKYPVALWDSIHGNEPGGPPPVPTTTGHGSGPPNEDWSPLISATAKTAHGYNLNLHDINGAIYGIATRR